MVQIKGTALKEAVEQVKAHAGLDAFENILRQLDAESRKIIESDLVSSNWYALDHFARFLEVQNRVLAGGKEEMIIRGAEAANERQLRGVYKAFVKVGSPEFVIERLAAVHATYFQGVTIEVQLQALLPLGNSLDNGDVAIQGQICEALDSATWLWPLHF